MTSIGFSQAIEIIKMECVLYDAVFVRDLEMKFAQWSRPSPVSTVTTLHAVTQPSVPHATDEGGITQSAKKGRQTSTGRPRGRPRKDVDTSEVRDPTFRCNLKSHSGAGQQSTQKHKHKPRTRSQTAGIRTKVEPDFDIQERRG